MKRCLLCGILAFLLAAGSAASGYWVGFRQGWGLGQMAIAVPRGAAAITQVHFLEKGSTEPIRFQLESDIDSGLVWWHQIDQFPLRPALNVLSGNDVLPAAEVYVRRLAAYRKVHPSPLADPTLKQQMLDNVREEDPAFAKYLEDGWRQHHDILQEMLEK